MQAPAPVPEAGAALPQPQQQQQQQQQQPQPTPEQLQQQQLQQQQQQPLPGSGLPPQPGQPGQQATLDAANGAKGPIDIFAYITKYRNDLATDCSKIEDMIAGQELAYLQAEHSQAGTVLKGFEGFLSSKEALRKRARSWKPDDRLFSLSSKTSPVTRELEAEEAEEMLHAGGFGKKGYAAKGYASKGKGQR